MTDRQPPVLTQVLAKYLPEPSDRIRSTSRAIIDRTTISVHSYESIPIADWFWHSGDHSARSWRFSLHSFAPLDALMACGEWTETQALVREWADAFGTPDLEDLGDFPWHDHATALRLDRLSVLRLLSKTPKFTDLAARHADVLMQEAFYSKHTNHGYDQALALLLASYAFKADIDTSAWTEMGLSRLIDELKFAFTPDGVHVENSPAYHVGMTANLVRARLVKALAGVETEFDFDTLLNDALAFTAWIIGPDRRLAMLGDSTERSGLPPTELSSFPNYAHALYAASGGTSGAPLEGTSKIFDHAGYAVYRSRWSPWNDHVHLTMKSGFLSRYHRQDDDLTVLLQGFGEHWLIDSGLYNHNQMDPVRIYMRSELAHNVPHIRGCPVSRTLPEPDAAPTLTMERPDDGSVVFRGTTNAYRNTAVTRTVVIESAETFQIVDTVRSQNPEAQTLFQFHVPANKTVRATTKMARIVGRTKELIIRVAAGEVGDARVFSGLDGPFKSAYSPRHNALEPTQVIVFGPLKGNRIRFRANFQDLS
ncbi:hypothetical protein DXV76_04285 [Rhodobacteraceae bacterium CCMM004]|nr:hypothetical protein DXV76_04285 [Rhodobacteraceae bacterium CCMM004]